MKQWTISLAILFIFGVAIMSTACNQPESSTVNKESKDPLVGAWKLVDMENVDSAGQATHPAILSGMVIFSSGYYSYDAILGDQARPLPDTAWNTSDEDAIATFRALLLNVGKYEMNGSKLTIHPIINKFSELEGGRLDIDYQLEGDTLRMTLRHVVTSRNDEPLLFSSGGHSTSTLVRMD